MFVVDSKGTAGKVPNRPEPRAPFVIFIADSKGAVRKVTSQPEPKTPFVFRINGVEQKVKIQEKPR